MKTTNNYNAAFWNMMRGASTKGLANITEGEKTDGCYILPTDTDNLYQAALKKDNLFRRLATVIRTDNSRMTGTVVTAEGAAQWVAEGQEFPEGADILTQFPISVHKLATMMRMKNDFLMDSGFDLESYLSKEFARRFGKAEEYAFLNGSGKGEPWGILNDTNGAEVGVTVDTADTITHADMSKLFFTLAPEYRQNAVWIMNDETIKTLRTQVDANGNFLWRDATADTLMGKPVVVSNHMPSASTGAKPVAFGAIDHYWIVERQPLAVARYEELYACRSETGFFAYERLDGRLAYPEAIKVLQMA